METHAFSKAEAGKKAPISSLITMVIGYNYSWSPIEANSKRKIEWLLDTKISGNGKIKVGAKENFWSYSRIEF